VLNMALKKKIGKFLDKLFYMSIAKIILSSLVMLGVILLINYYLSWDITANFQDKAIYLLVTIVAGAFSFFIVAYFLKSREIHALVKLVKNRLGRS